MNLFLCILLVTICFSIAVLLVSIINNCSIGKAVCIIKKFLTQIFEALFEPTENLIVYPSIIGFQNGRIIATYIEESFRLIYPNFKSCYFQVYYFLENNNGIVYKFSIKRKNEDIDVYDLECLLQKQAEEILSHQLLMNNCYASAEALTCVVLREQELLIIYAINSEGIKILDKEKEKIRYRKYIESNLVKKNTNTLEEKWSDKL